MDVIGIGLVVAVLLGLMWVMSKPKTCPRCGMLQPRFRKPQGARELLWGGWTCPNCGCRMDRYGRERST